MNYITQLLKQNTDIWLTADLHFNHKKIIEYCLRPFHNVDMMNDFLIESWNYFVKENDIVLVLGDFGFGNKEMLYPIIEQLNGNITLLAGNHDKRNTNKFWNGCVDNYYKKPFKSGDIWFSHEPLDIDFDEYNIHGHLHGIGKRNYVGQSHYEVGVDLHGYRPIKLSYVKARLWI